MLYKFTASDMLNTALIDVATGERAYNILTVLAPSSAKTETETGPVPSTSSSSSPSASFVNKKSSPPRSDDAKDTERRFTTVTNASGAVIASIHWHGRRPDIIIGKEKVGALTDLFGSSTVPFMPKALAVPTRFDTEYVWNATADSLTLFDYDTETVKGSFHHNTIRIPSKPSKSKPTSPSSTHLASHTSSSSLSLSTASTSTASSSSTHLHRSKSKSTFIPTHLPGIGSSYLEFEPHALADDIELILSFLMMEILRRGRFALTPYTFQKPRLWQFREAKDLIMRRLRRNTI
ncbi:hypothetical protein D9619_005370 [Psilocybe cf. subviscida]|uniref:Uncharacterized protein n=1 Tax=Psilocybe cf. subviscida TaxID=2480587 RepID=A0A8H5BY36_9AGAR|nr:hypothetical protein D9619_005370 [Psilocybe cf. subviscida]